MNTTILTKEKFEETKSFLQQINQLVVHSNENLQRTNQKLEQAHNLINTAAEIHLESKRLDNENLKLKKEIAAIVSDFKLKQGYLQAVFSERSRIIDKHFEAIDKGLREGNDEMVLQGLRSAGDFVSTNPLDNFETFRSILLDKHAPLDLDF